ncbi:MAG: type 4a pilus biogenesis protein PilO [Candidatus Levybacteria bacterium]|nr:type 4a pilus biogenesis protein PilO [Candidatus Levybacteria bacterium]
METKIEEKNTYRRLYKNLSPFFKEEKTQNFTTLALTLVALSLFGLFAINPTITTIVHLRKQLTDSRYVEQKLQEKIANLNSLQQAYTSLKNDIPIIIAAMPQKPQVPLFTAQIQRVAIENQITIIRLQVFQVELSKNQKQEKYGSFGFALDVEGAQNNLTKFLSSLVGFERIISIENIALGKIKTVDTSTLSLRGKAYFKL